MVSVATISSVVSESSSICNLSTNTTTMIHIEHLAELQHLHTNIGTIYRHYHYLNNTLWQLSIYLPVLLCLCLVHGHQLRAQTIHRVLAHRPLHTIVADNVAMAIHQWMHEMYHVISYHASIITCCSTWWWTPCRWPLQIVGANSCGTFPLRDRTAYMWATRTILTINR